MHTKKDNYSSVTATLTKHHVNSWQGNLRFNNLLIMSHLKQKKVLALRQTSQQTQ